MNKSNLIAGTEIGYMGYPKWRGYVLRIEDDGTIVIRCTIKCDGKVCDDDFHEYIPANLSGYVVLSSPVSGTIEPEPVPPISEFMHNFHVQKGR
jgi:hypothetical protein